MYRGCKTQGDSAGYKSSIALVQLKAECTHAAAVFVFYCFVVFFILKHGHKFYPITKYIRSVRVAAVIYVNN